MDPVSLVALIGSGLAVVDQFVNLAERLNSGRATDHGGHVEAREDAVVIVDHGHVTEVAAGDLDLDAFDRERYDALWARVKINWKQYNGLDVERAMASADEKVRLGVRMDHLKAELCPDFRDVVRMYEAVLHVHLPDHYSLYSVCGPLRE